MERPPRVSHPAYFSPYIPRPGTINCGEPSAPPFSGVGAELKKSPRMRMPGLLT